MPGIASPSSEHVGPDDTDLPWQLRLFSKGLKKRQKVALLLRQIRELPGARRLLITHGDNNGAINYELRRQLGTWTWMEMEAGSIPDMSALLGEPVGHASPDRLPAESESFDIVVSLDVQEHLSASDLDRYHAELVRVTASDGHVIATTPNGDPWKPVSILRRAIGMTKEKYGHVVYGYNIGQQQSMLRSAGLEPTGAASYSGFFTELIELGINFVYTTLMARTSRGGSDGEIAPTTAAQLARVERQYRLYAAAYPVLYLISRLDVLLPLGSGYAVSVVARRPGR